jgi:diguanylate cyclase (GGDEF)-like protein/putative nucleotidyltransferase with HDIG domain
MEAPWPRAERDLPLDPQSPRILAVVGGPTYSGFLASSTNGITVPSSRATMARTAAIFYISGALISGAALVAPHEPEMDEALLAATGGAAGLIGLLILAFRTPPPRWAFQPLTVVGTALSTVAVYAWGPGSSYGPLPYLWVTFFAFYFFPMRLAAAHLALIAAGFAAELIAQPLDYTPVAGWIATVATLALTGVVVTMVRDRLASLIEGLTDAARRDPLTELLNRRGFEEVFDIELERARRTDSMLSLVVGDLDRFKRINDAFGHAVGDEALKRIARCIGSTKRSFDSAARIGGEEFALLAPDSDEHGAYVLAERIRGEVERSFASGTGPLTASFGIATFPVHGQSAEALLRAADQALYAAKRLGRNRSVISSAEVPGILARAPHGGEDSTVELGSLLRLAEALDVRDSGNATHCHRVGRFAELIARELGMAPDSVERLRLAGILHDVGRVGVPDEVFKKEGPLSEEEWTWIRSHPAIGARMVETTHFEDIRGWILCHHERPDGRGYPEGRVDPELPLEAKILAVADAYDAMTSERPYRQALSPDEAAEELRQGAGRQFDEQVVEALLRVV